MDILTTDNGDIYIDGNDISIGSVAEFVGQRIRHVLRSKPGDWGRYPDKGAHIQQYIGYPNIPSTKTLVETEVSEEFDRDNILGNLDTEIIYTPTSKDSALIEVKVYLPDGELLEITEILKLTGSMVGKEDPSFTQASYNTDNEIIRTEIATITNSTNVFELKYVPANNLIFIVPFASDIDLDASNQLNVVPEVTEQQIDIAFDIPWSDGIVAIYDDIITDGVSVLVDGNIVDETNFEYDISGIVISGVSTLYTRMTVEYETGVSGVTNTIVQQLPDASQYASGMVFDTRGRTFPFSSEITTIFEDKLVQSISITKDGENMAAGDKSKAYATNISNRTISGTVHSNDISIRIPGSYSVPLAEDEYEAGYETFGLGSAPSEEVHVSLSWYNTGAITGVNILPEDAMPRNIFPRTRTTDRCLITTKNIYSPGTYFLQYTTYELEV